ncbi:MAG TPA: outer membrane lipoprotein carrier protein LolA [Anaeromyxobacteraceae bacterium]|nr:outer membrane lipoprotein carrier protein LolA [Anaeromyxobacteraceae bacterium]
MIALLAAALLVAAPPTVEPDALRARYARLRSLSADVVQLKEGRFWARPLESRVRLRYTPERVVWETLTPVRSTVTIEGGALTVVGADGRPRDLAPVANDRRLAGLVRFIQALLAVDLPAIERDFVLSYGPGQLVATPRPGGALDLFTGIVLRFDSDLDLVSLELDTTSERTRLSFHNVKRDLAPERP